MQIYNNEKKKKKREKYYIHPPISNRNVTRKNNGPEYIRLEILHSVHYTRKKTQNSDDANTRRYSLSSLPPSLPPPLRLVSFSLVENRIYDVYMLALFRVMHIGATRHRASLHYYLYTTEKHPFPLVSMEGRPVGRASTESFTLATTISSPREIANSLCRQTSGKYRARQTKSRNAARAFRLTDNFPSADAPREHRPLV